MGQHGLKFHDEVCTKCGTTFQRATGRRKFICPKCVNARVVEVLTAQHEKSGPLYEKIVRETGAYWKAEAKRLGIRL